MTMSLSKERRQEIVKDFATRHNGIFNPKLFLEEVRDAGESHPAFQWFTWDLEEAAFAYQVEQARSFARDLRVTFKIEEVTAPHQVRIREEPIPAVISPMASRNSGGGYVLTNPYDPEHIAEHCRQAAKTLEQWRGRYSAALAHCRISAGDVEKIIGRLERGADDLSAP